MVTNANPAMALPGIPNVMTAELYGLSTDSKPTQEVPNGSAFVEIDTGKVFFFNSVSHAWINISEGAE